MQKKFTNTNHLTTVMYHYVRDFAHTRYPAIRGIAPHAFDGQLGYIQKHYSVIAMEELFERLADDAALPERPLLLTFDDGLADHHEMVLPLLEKRRMRGSFFPPGRAIAERVVLDVHKIHFILAASPKVGALARNIRAFLDEHREAYALPPYEAYQEQYAVGRKRDGAEVMFVKNMLQKGLPETLRRVLIRELFARIVTADEKAFAHELYMDAAALRHMKQRGMYIGSHGWNHAWLNTLSEEKREEEVARSSAFLAALGVNIKCWAISYPHGGYDKALMALLRRHGCVAGFTTEVGIGAKGENPLAYRRLDTNDLPFDPVHPFRAIQVK